MKITATLKAVYTKDRFVYEEIVLDRYGALVARTTKDWRGDARNPVDARTVSEWIFQSTKSMELRVDAFILPVFEELLKGTALAVVEAPPEKTPKVYGYCRGEEISINTPKQKLLDVIEELGQSRRAQSDALESFFERTLILDGDRSG